MRHLTKEALDAIAKKCPQLGKIHIFVETGTYKGGTTFPMSKHFKEVYTIEINEKAYNFCKDMAKKKGLNNIRFFLGDSAKKMAKIIKATDAPKLYFLDGHVTENGSGFTGRGVCDVPLLQELNAINEHDPHASVIIIDDMRLFGVADKKACAGADWSQINITNLLKQFDAGRVKDHFVDPSFNPNKTNGKKLENDRYVIVLNAKAQ